MTLRIGSVPYLVGRPLDGGLESAAGLQYSQAVPSALIHDLRQSKLDAGLVSSIELFRQPEYCFAEGLGVTGFGQVDSVQVFLRRPMEQVQRIALDPSSRAAAALVKVLLAERAGGPPEYLEVPSDQDPAEVDADAWLRIGDRALRETWIDGIDHWNPSKAWFDQTGLPFVFALWLMRDRGTAASLQPILEEAAGRGEGAREELARRGAEELDLPLGPLRNYLCQQCVFQPGEALRPALTRFGQEARALGLASHDLPIEGVEPTSPEAPGVRRVPCPD